MITHAAASAAILAHCDAGTLVQKEWHGRAADGRAVACLLGAIDLSVEKAADCNAELMPMWLAELTPVLFDGLPADAVYPIARRYGSLVGRWHQLSESQWNAILATFLCHIIDRAVNYARPAYENHPCWPQVLAACEQSKMAIESGDKVATEAAYMVAARAAIVTTEVAAFAMALAEAAAKAPAKAAAAACAVRVDCAVRVVKSAIWVVDAVLWTVNAATAYEQLFVFLLDKIEQALP